MSITNGSVRYLKRVNLGNYEHEEAAADIGFVVPEGGDYAVVLREAQGTALDTVYRMLGLRSDTVAPVTPAPDKAPLLTGDGATVTGAASKPETKRGGKAKASDPLASPTGSVPTESAEASDATAGIAVSELPPVSDSDLTSFVAKRNDELIAAHAAANGGDGRAGTAKLRECVAEYSGVTPPTVRGIPAEKRRDFMKAAKALS